MRGTILRMGSAAVLAAAAVTLTRCGPSETSPDTSRPSEFGFQTSVQTSLVEEGRAAYATYCVGCHGENGDGNGESARFFHPRPRNFQEAKFKFSTTRSGRLPTDEDLRRTITRGLKGTAMPGWDLLPARTVTALIAYIKTFSPKWTERSPASPIPMIEDPYRSQADKSAAIARGEAVYHGYATCWTCHPAYVGTEKINEYLVAMENPTREVFRPLLHQSEAKPNDEGELIYPPDFHRDFVRSGGTVDDLYRSISAGITGTAMPTWVDAMETRSVRHPEIPLTRSEDLWAMSYYVHRLILERPARLQPGQFEVRERPHRILKSGESFQPAEPLQAPDEAPEFIED